MQAAAGQQEEEEDDVMPRKRPESIKVGNDVQRQTSSGGRFYRNKRAVYVQVKGHDRQLSSASSFMDGNSSNNAARLTRQPSLIHGLNCH